MRKNSLEAYMTLWYMKIKHPEFTTGTLDKMAYDMFEPKYKEPVYSQMVLASPAPKKYQMAYWLSEQGLQQQDIADLLETSQPNISHYIKRYLMAQTHNKGYYINMYWRTLTNQENERTKRENGVWS